MAEHARGSIVGALGMGDRALAERRAAA